MAGSSTRRRPWVAGLLSLACSGLGHVYSGRVVAGVGVAGDTVEVRDGRLVLNGNPAERERLDRPCTYEAPSENGAWARVACVEFVERLDGHSYGTSCTPDAPCGDVPPSRIPPRHVWILGDFRDHSADSRVFGPVPEAAIVGRVSHVLLSIGPSGLRPDRFGTAVR